MLRWASPPLLRCYFRFIFFDPFLLGRTRDHPFYLYRCYSPVTSTTRLCYITDCTCVVCRCSRVATVSNPFYSWIVTFVLYSFLSEFCDRNPLSCVFPTPLFTESTDSLGCQEETSTSCRGREDSTFRISRYYQQSLDSHSPFCVDHTL